MNTYLSQFSIVILGVLLLGLPAVVKAAVPPTTVANAMDITANWQYDDGMQPGLQVKEPAIKPGSLKMFRQSLRLPVGQHSIVLRYEPTQDVFPDQALGGKRSGFAGLSINGAAIALNFAPDTKNPDVLTASAQFTATAAPTQFALNICATRPMITTLSLQKEFEPKAGFAAVRPDTGGEYLLAKGIPFILSMRHTFQLNLPEPDADRGELKMWNKEGVSYDLGGQTAKRIHFLGMTPSIDIANGSWYSKKGDNGYNHFVGDQAGIIEIEFADGIKQSVPLVFGFNFWYGRPWDIIWHYTFVNQICGYANKDDGSFDNSDTVRALFHDGIWLQDAYRVPGSRSNNARYLFTLDVGGKAIRTIRILGDSKFYTHPVISAITLETVAAAVKKPLLPLPSPAMEKTLTRPVTLAQVKSETWRPGVEAMMRNLYTYVDDLPLLKEPQVTAGYFGPDYNFRGTQQAIYAATYLYRNGPECGSYIADTGMGCSSPVSSGSVAQYCSGMGVRVYNIFNPTPYYGNLTNWFTQYQTKQPGQLPGAFNGWTRGVGELLREGVAFGYDKFANNYIDWLDKCLMTEANPPHWNRVAGAPTFDTAKRMVGETEERGNRENDGHGICMWGRYMVWHWQGQPRDWNEKHWIATKAAVDWIQWQLDTDTLFPGKRKDVLYTESECSHGDYEIYSTYNCLHGVGLSIRMAQQLGKQDEVQKWTALYNRLRKGILENLTDTSKFGPIWHTYPNTDWQDHAHKLAPIQLATEGISYTPLQHYAASDELDQKILEISRNTYKFLMKQKNYNCLRMFGYGQGMMTQSALLLDEMNDAEQFLNTMLTHCYLPKYSGWASPEGIIVHRDGKYYLPVNGYLGQDSHAADSTKAVRLTLGIDDNNPAELRMVPRYPDGWNEMSIAKYPVLTGASRQQISYQYLRSAASQSFSFQLSQRASAVSVRLGPIPAGKQVTGVTLDGSKYPFETQQSGDSSWVWIRGINSQSGQIVLALN